MPQVIAAPLIAAAGATGIGAMAIQAIVGLAFSAVLSFASKALVKKPKTPEFSVEARDRTVSARQPIAPWRVIYGNVRIGGVYTFLHTTGSSKEFFHIVITLAGHEVKSIGNPYFDGVEVPLDANGDAIGDYAGFVHVEKNLGTVNQAAFPGLVSAAPDKWTVNHRQRGRAGCYVRLKWNPDKFPNGLPNITFLVEGKTDIYEPRNSPGTTGYSTNWALCVANYLCDPVIGVGADYATEIDEGSLIEAANISDEQVGQAEQITPFTVATIEQSVTATASASTDALTHGGSITFNAGDTLTVAPTAVAPVGTVNNGTYYVVLLDANTFRLSHTRLNNEGGGETTVIVFSQPVGTMTIGGQAATVALGTNVFTAASHGFTDNQQVNLVVASTLPAPLTTDTTYYAIVDDTTTIRLAASLADATSSPVVPIDLTTNGTGIVTITRTGVINDSSIELETKRQWLTGDLVQVTNSESPADLPAPLTEGTNYYVIRTADNRFQLAASLEDAMAGTFIPLTDIGSGDHSVSLFSQARYTINGTFETSETPYDVITRMMSAAGGRVIYSGGKWHIRAGAYRTPTVTLSEADIVGPVRVQTKVSRRESFNGVKGVYTSPENDWQPDDFPAVQVPAYVAEDGNEERWKDIDLPFTTSSSSAQRLARMDLERGRRQITVELTAKTKAYRLMPGDTVGLTLSRYGWTAKTFDVQSVQLTPDLSPKIALTLRETDSNVYAWTSDDETPTEAAPTTDLPNPFIVAAPTGLTATSGNDDLFVDTDGTVVARMRLLWTAPADVFVDRYELSYRKEGDNVASLITLGPGSTEFWVSPVKSADVYYVSLVAVNSIGTRSEVASLTHTVLGKSDLPPDITTFLVTQDADGTRRFSGTYTNKPLDFAGYRIKYTASLPIDWDTATPLLADNGLVGALPFETNQLSAGTYEFAIKPVDTSGNEAANERVVQVTLGDPRLRNAIYTRNEFQEGFPGTKTDCDVNYEGILEPVADTGGSWDDFANSPAKTWDDLAGQWWSISPRVGTIVYRTPVIDLGTNVSFTPLVAFEGNGTATITMATGADGDSPTVGSFGAIGQVATKRYIQFEVEVTDATSPRISDIRIILDGDRLTDTFEDINTGTETAPWFQSIAPGHFKVASRKPNMALITTARIDALQNVGPGWSWEVIDKATTVSTGGEPAAEFKIYDGSGSLADAVIDLTLIGPKDT